MYHTGCEITEDDWFGDLFYGLYRLRLASPTPSSQTFSASTLASTCSLNYHIPSNVIWHFRLEHFSNQRLSQMHHLYHNIHVDNKSICDICHFPKQKKLPYSLSTSIVLLLLLSMNCCILIYGSHSQNFHSWS